MIIGHGGNKQELARKLGCRTSDIIDMSSNLNPLGPPDFVEQAIKESLWTVRSLPEPDALSMRKGFADYINMDVNRVIAGNGTTFFIYTLPLALGSKNVLICGPTYSDYKDSCLMHNIGFQHCHARMPDRFAPDIDTISKMAKDADTVFFCNPNNPTGTLASKEDILFLLKTHQETVFVIDESYLPFSDRAEAVSLVSETGYDNLVVLSSMSKIFRIPGLRTGFLTAPADLAQKMMAHYQPWSVNAIAQEVVTHIFNRPERIEPFYKQTRAFIKTEKAHFLDRLKSVDGLDLFESHAYFILARLTGEIRSKVFCDRVGKNRLLIRDCSNFIGLSDEYVRFSLKERDINDRLAVQIKKAVCHD